MALVFLANMSVFTKNAWFSENVHFVVLSIFFRLVSFLFHLVFMCAYCVGGRGVPGHLRFPREYGYFHEDMGFLLKKSRIAVCFLTSEKFSSIMRPTWFG